MLMLMLIVTLILARFRMSRKQTVYVLIRKEVGRVFDLLKPALA